MFDIGHYRVPGARLAERLDMVIFIVFRIFAKKA